MYHQLSLNILARVTTLTDCLRVLARADHHKATEKTFIEDA